MAWKPWEYAPKDLLDKRRAERLKKRLSSEVSGATKSVKRTAREIASDADRSLNKVLDPDEWQTAGRKMGNDALSVLDAPSKYVGRPAVAALTGGLTSDRHRAEDGSYYRDPGGWGDFLPTLGKVGKGIITGDIEGTYQDLRQASDERWRNPELQKDIAGRVALGAASDPLSFIPGGAAKSVLPASLRATRGGRAALAAAEVLETPRRALAYGTAGSAAGGYAAEKLGAPEFVGELAGGILAGSYGAATAKRPTARGVAPSQMVDMQHPKVDAYIDALDRHQVPYEFDEFGVIVPDEEKLFEAMRDLDQRISDQRGGKTVRVRKGNGAYTTGFDGKHVPQGKVSQYLPKGEPDPELVADFERLREVQDEMIPPPEFEDARVARMEELKNRPANKPQSKYMEKKLAREAAEKAKRAEEVAQANAGPRAFQDGSYTLIRNADGTSQRIWTGNSRTTGPRATKARARMREILAEEQAKWDEMQKGGAQQRPTARGRSKAARAEAALNPDTGVNVPAQAADMAPTVRTRDIEGNVIDTGQTETQLNGWRGDDVEPVPERSFQGDMNLQTEGANFLDEAPQQMPQERTVEGWNQAVGDQMPTSRGRTNPLPTRVQRFEEPGVGPGTTDKPHGLYTTPADVESPHADLGGERVEMNVNQQANVLDVSDIPDAEIVMRKGATTAGSGVAAARKILGPEEFARMKALTKTQLIAEAKKLFPDRDYAGYYDKQEVMEAIGGDLARREGYDAIYFVDAADPAFTEFVGLNENAFAPEATPKKPGKKPRAKKPTAKKPTAKPEEIRATMDQVRIENPDMSVGEQLVETMKRLDPDTPSAPERLPRPAGEPESIPVPGGPEAIDPLRAASPEGYEFRVPDNFDPEYRRILTERAMAWSKAHPAPPAVTRNGAREAFAKLGTTDEVLETWGQVVSQYHPLIVDPSDTLSQDWRRLQNGARSAYRRKYMNEALESLGVDRIDELDALQQAQLTIEANNAAKQALRDVELEVLGEDLYPDIKDSINQGAGGNLDRTTDAPRQDALDPSLAPPAPPSDMPPPRGVGPGGQPVLGQTDTGTDLLMLPTREDAIARETEYLGSRAGRLDQGIRKGVRSTVGSILKEGGAGDRALTLVRDPRIQPIQRGVNTAKNRRSFLRAVAEQKLRKLARSGIEFERRADGNWVEKRSGVIWSDIVEQDTDAGRAAYAALTPEQKAAIEDVVRIKDQAIETAAKYGKTIAEMEHEGKHWSRKVESIAGVDKATGLTSSSRIGSVRGVAKERTRGAAMDAANPVMVNGQPTGAIVYAHPFDAFLQSLDETLKTATDGWVEQMVRPLQVKDVSNFATLNVPTHPALSPMQFEPEVANQIRAALDEPGRSAVGAFVAGLNSFLTPIRASLDLSSTFQQGATMWVTNPKAAAKHFKTALHSLAKDDVFYDAVDSVNARVDGILEAAGIEHEGGGLQWLASRGTRITGEMSHEEFALKKVGGALKDKPGLKQYNWAAELSQNHFDRLLNLYRADVATDELEKLIEKGLRGADLDREMQKVSQAVNRTFGWSDNKPSTLESIGMFAPRFFRSNIENLYKATTDWDGIEGAIARRRLGAWAAAGTALTVAVNEARGYETEFRPWEPRFMTMRNVGGVNVSVFGPYDTLVRYMAQGGEQALTGELPTAPLKLAQAKASPVLGQAIAQVKGETYMGEPLDSPQKRIVEAFKGIVPFGVQNVIEQGYENGSWQDALTSGAVSAIGLKNNPVSPSERVKFARTGHSGHLGLRTVDGEAQRRFGTSYDELSGTQRGQVNQAPEIRRWQAEADRRASKQDNRRGQQTQIRETVARELEAAGAFYAAGKDSAGNPFTGNDYRESYNDTMKRAAGAYKLIGPDERDDEVSRWFALYDQAEMPNGAADYDKLERLQAEFRAKHPGIDEKVDKVTGIRDDQYMRELREARKQAAAYYAIPAYRGMSLEESERAGQVLKAASDMVRFGIARSRGEAFRMLAREDQAGVALARKAINRKANPLREKFRKNSPLFAKYYSDAPLTWSADAA